MSALDDLLAFAKGQGYQVTSTTGGQHVPGSLHYLGRAIDIGSNGVDQNKLFSLAKQRGFRVLPELYTGQGTYGPSSGPHYHIDTGLGLGGAQPARAPFQSVMPQRNMAATPVWDNSALLPQQQQQQQTPSQQPQSMDWGNAARYAESQTFGGGQLQTMGSTPTAMGAQNNNYQSVLDQISNAKAGINKQYEDLKPHHPIISALLGLGLGAALGGMAGGGTGALLGGLAGGGGALGNYNKRLVDITDKQNETLRNLPSYLKAVNDLTGQATIADQSNMDTGTSYQAGVPYEAAVAQGNQRTAGMAAGPMTQYLQDLRTYNALSPQQRAMVPRPQLPNTGATALPPELAQALLSQSGQVGDTGLTQGINQQKAPSEILHNLGQAASENANAGKTGAETIQIPADSQSERQLKGAQSSEATANAQVAPIKAQADLTSANAAAKNAQTALEKLKSGKTDNPAQQTKAALDRLHAKQLELVANGLGQIDGKTKSFMLKGRPSDSVKGAMWDKLTKEYTDLANQAAGTAASNVTPITTGTVKSYGNGKFKASF